MSHLLNGHRCSHHSKIFLIFLLLSCLAYPFESHAKKFKHLEISCPGEHHSKDIYRSGIVSKSWIQPPEYSPTCRPNPVVQEAKIENPRNIQLMNVHPNPKENPIQITQVLVTTKDSQIIEVNCSHSSIVLDKSSAYLFTVITKCKSTNYSGADWGVVNITLHSDITNERISFYYQKLCGSHYESRFEWGYIVLLLISIILVGIGSLTITTIVKNEELKIVHVFTFVAVITGCYILLYYWAEEIEFPVSILFSFVSFLAAAFVLNNILKNFISQGDCLMIKFNLFCLGKITLTNVFCGLLASGLVAVWYWKKNWIIGNILAICLLLASMKLAKVTSMKVGVALLVFVIAAHALWSFVAAVLKHPVNSPTDSFINLPLSITFPRLIELPTKGTCSAITITDSIFPGLFIAFCYRYDKAKGLKLFYIAGMFGYILGIVLHTTFFYTGVIILNPILYLGPCTLLCVFIIAFRRNEHKDIWDGLQSEREFVAHLLRNIDDEDKNNPQIPDFDHEIFESIDLKKQTERMSLHYSGALTSSDSNSVKKIE